MLVKQDVPHSGFTVPFEIIILLLLIFAILALFFLEMHTKDKGKTVIQIDLVHKHHEIAEYRRRGSKLPRSPNLRVAPISFSICVCVCVCFYFMDFDEMWYRGCTLKVTPYCSLPSSVVFLFWQVKKLPVL
jgi:hypothetical protein